MYNANMGGNMPVSEDQRKAACAEIGYRKKNKGKTKNFKNMSIAKLAEWCRSKTLDKK